MITNYKKLIVLYFILVILCISFLPILNYQKNSKLFTIEKMFNTDIIESYRNYFVYKLFNKSLNSHNVIAGKDGFLFLGNKYASVIFKTQNLYSVKKNEIKTWIEKLKQLQQWYENKGIKFIFTIVPNKHTIYREKLPNWLQYQNNNITDRVINQAQVEQLNVLDLRPILLAQKDNTEENLYLKTDSHWNGLGAAFAYDAVINYLNEIYELGISKTKFNFKYRTAGGLDLSYFMKITSFIPKDYERVMYYTFDKHTEICMGKIEEGSNKILNCEFSINKSTGVHDGAKYIVNQQPQNNQKVLILGDSFTTANSQLYNLTFNTVWKFHILDLYGKDLSNFIEKIDPDIVIYHVVERDLYPYKYLTYPEHKTSNNN